MAKPRIVEQFATVQAMEDRINELYLKPSGERYDPITVTETTENFTVVFGLFKAPYRRT
jgi:SOS-response transcriptional repressor LexA